MHTSSLLFGALAVLASAAASQSIVVPNANATTRGVSGLDILTRSTRSAGTYMLGIAAAQVAGIPPGSVINGISLRSSIPSFNPMWPPNFNTTWTDYEVVVGNAIPLATWTTTFASNFMGAPVMVRDGSMVIELNRFWHNAALPAPQPNNWGDFAWDFQRTFVYNGGDLGILFTHPGSSQPETSAFFTDCSSSVAGVTIALTANTFQAATGTNTTSFIIPRIHYGYGSGCPGTNNQVPNLVLTNDVRGSDRITSISIGNAAPSQPAAYLFGISATSIPLANGCTLLTNPVTTYPLPSLSPYGRTKLTANVLPSLQGVIYVQAFILDPGAPGGYAGTNGVTLTISP